VTIPGTPGQANGTFVDMGNPHVAAVLGVTASAGEELDGPEFAALNSELAAASLPDVEMLDLVTKPVVNPAIESDQNVEFLRFARWTRSRIKVRRSCASTSVAWARPCPAAPVCAPRAWFCRPSLASTSGR
jgi:hypothetical protein